MDQDVIFRTAWQQRRGRRSAPRPFGVVIGVIPYPLEADASADQKFQHLGGFDDVSPPALAIGGGRIFGQADRRVEIRHCELFIIDNALFGHETIAGYPHRSAGSRSEEHTSALQSLMRISYAVFCLKKKKNTHKTNNHTMRGHLNTTQSHQHAQIITRPDNPISSPRVRQTRATHLHPPQKYATHVNKPTQIKQTVDSTKNNPP